MAWDGVPWFVGGSAEHSPEVARLLSYAAFGGAEGIVGPGDLVVREQSVPDDTIQVYPGACAILNRASAQEYQAYAARLPSAESVAISPTDSTGGRSDLIVARVEDPYLTGEPWGEPADPTAGPYIFTRVVPNVPNTTRSLQEVEPGQSGIALARIDIPVSTGTINQSMITDLRDLVFPRRLDLQRMHNQTASGNTLGSTYENWPLQAVWSIDIPSWAVRAQIVGTTTSFRIDENSGSGGNVFGNFRIRLGSDYSPKIEFNHSMPSGLGTIDTGMARVSWDAYLPASVRGTSQTLALQGRRNGGTVGCDVLSSGGQVTDFQVIFYEAPDAQGWEQ